MEDKALRMVRSANNTFPGSPHGCVEQPRHARVTGAPQKANPATPSWAYGAWHTQSMRTPRCSAAACKSARRIILYGCNQGALDGSQELERSHRLRKPRSCRNPFPRTGSTLPEADADVQSTAPDSLPFLALRIASWCASRHLRKDWACNLGHYARVASHCLAQPSAST